MYDPDWEGPHLIWPPYHPAGVRKGVLSEREGRQVRACYGAKLSMIDAWVGRVLDAIDAQGLRDDTAVIVCTDHGHYLGEKDFWGKPAVPIHEPLGHTPLFIRWPGVAPRDVSALTTSVDLFATLMDLFGAQAGHRTHARSLVPLVRGDVDAVRDWALAGIWGREVHLIDPRYKYARAPTGANAPLSMWSNRWSSMPRRGVGGDIRMPRPDARAFLDRMPGSDVPVIRQPFREGDLLPFWALGGFHGSRLFDLEEDPGEDRDLTGTPLEKDLEEKLRVALREVEAPDDQFERLGLA
jgi:hypothetical protein